MPKTGVTVHMGRVLDGVSDHMKQVRRRLYVCPEQRKEPGKKDVVAILRESRTEMLLNYLPVGSEEATKFYAECALEAGVAFINNIPVFIASNPGWAQAV